MPTKKCSKCGEIKILSEFYKDSTHGDSLASRCKKCVKGNNHIRYIENREERLIYQKIYSSENKAKIREYLKVYCKHYYGENRDKILEQIKRYKHENKAKVNQIQRRYYKNNINYRIKSIMWRMITANIKNKTNKMIALLGCTIEEFKKYFEDLFTVGMSWGNYGEWHIDHILPCSAFELQNSEEQEICFHYINLQPLWAEDNFKKRDRLIIWRVTWPDR